MSRLTLSTLVRSTPVAVETFLSHIIRRGRRRRRRRRGRGSGMESEDGELDQEGGEDEDGEGEGVLRESGSGSVKDEGKTQRNDLLDKNLTYAELFHLSKHFMHVATHAHTVESVQAFFNAYTPAPPWVKTAKVYVGPEQCRLAASLLIQAIGGEAKTKELVGGTRWWTARHAQGVPCEWITIKPRHTVFNPDEPSRSSAAPPLAPDLPYHPDMVDRPVIYYIHGGAYYFGSVNSHRYSIWRYARKTHSRAFAVDYRKAPQYPFPCPLHDVLAAYLFLIDPPSTAAHQPVPPALITIAGDSAGGGLTLALLQVLRDTGLPLPAGAILISPWCDLTHSFPSILSNTDTDMLPPYGFIHRQSPLWPPPSESFQKHARHSLAVANKVPKLALGTKRSSNEDQIHLKIDNVDTTLDGQIQLYATNSQLCHPLVSPVMGYLGDLCPLYFLAGDAEVLRDEIIYTAHKAAHPDSFPCTKLSTSVRRSIDGRPAQKTNRAPVHLQLWDDCCHCLPLFSPIEPAKYAYRAIATFSRFVTKTLEKEASHRMQFQLISPEMRSDAALSYAAEGTVTQNDDPISNVLTTSQSSFQSGYQTPDRAPPSAIHPSKFKNLRKRLSFSPRKPPAPAAAHQRRNSSYIADTASRTSTDIAYEQDIDVAGPNKPLDRHLPMPGTAGHSSVYADPASLNNMIRERVNIHGVLRPMESISEFAILQPPFDNVGTVLEAPAKRWLNGKEIWDKRYAHERRLIERLRHRNLKHAVKIAKVHQSLRKKESQQNGGETPTRLFHDVDGDASLPPIDSPLRVWYPFANEEQPSPSSIVARQDTSDAVALSKFLGESALPHDDHADQSHFTVNGLTIWQSLHNFLRYAKKSKPAPKEGTLQARNFEAHEAPKQWQLVLARLRVNDELKSRKS